MDNSPWSTAPRPSRPLLANQPDRMEGGKDVLQVRGLQNEMQSASLLIVEALGKSLNKLRLEVTCRFTQAPDFQDQTSDEQDFGILRLDFLAQTLFPHSDLQVDFLKPGFNCLAQPDELLDLHVRQPQKAGDDDQRLRKARFGTLQLGGGLLGHERAEAQTHHPPAGSRTSFR